MIFWKINFQYHRWTHMLNIYFMYDNFQNFKTWVKYSIRILIKELAKLQLKNTNAQHEKHSFFTVPQSSYIKVLTESSEYSLTIKFLLEH